MSTEGKIYISAYVIAEMIKYDKSIKGEETAALLIGEEINGDVYIEDIRIGDQKGTAVYVEITQEELIKAAIDISEREDNKVIVGWIHTHPGLSVFMSATDVNTQLIYQSLYPKAVSIIIDAVKFTKTGNLNDLQLGVFRVINGKQHPMPYEIIDSFELALNSYIHNDKIEIQRPNTTKQVTKETIVYSPVISTERIKLLKYRIDSIKDKMPEEEYHKIQSWIELAEAIQDGSIKEVPIDVIKLHKNLEESIEDVEYEINEVEELYFEQKGLLSFISIMIGGIIEIIIIYFLGFGL